MTHLLTHLRDKKALIIADLLSPLHYKPNREADLLALMKKYISAEPEQRPTLEPDLRACLDGCPYANPYTSPYTEEDVAYCDELLERFLHAASIDPPSAKRHRQTVLNKLEQLHTARHHGLLDDWRRQHIIDLLDTAVNSICLCPEHVPPHPASSAPQQMR
ncbi:MAG: hypothetical protein IJC43_04145 [Clostridia bacterium]|nr:hypothetical protein [Clostridia bacterium]